MKLVIVLCLVAAAMAAPADVQVLKYTNDNIGLGNYKYAYELSDGTRSEAEGELKNGGKEESFVAVKGQFAWISPEGITYTITYVADENGYNPTVENSATGTGLKG